MKRRLWCAVGLLACLSVLAAQAQDTATAARARIAAYGRISPDPRAITIAVPAYQGSVQIVSELLVREGDWVKAGQKLAITKNRELAAADLAIARAHVTTAEERTRALAAGPRAEEVDAQEATLASIQAEARALHARKLPDAAAAKAEAVAQQEAADAKATAAAHQLAAFRSVSPASLAVAQAEFGEAKAALARAETALASTEILAPAEGRILKLFAYPGEAAGSAGLLEMADTRAMIVIAELRVADAPQIAPGAPAVMKSEAWSGEMTGTVKTIRPRVERSQLTALSTFANVDRQIVEAIIEPSAPARLADRTGAEVTIQIQTGPPAK